MSVYSMTGYANASAQASPPPDFPGVPEGTPRVTLQVELRSVNSRFLDLSLKIPDEMRGLEPALRELLTAQFRRGKIELRLHTQSRSSDGPHVPAGEQLQRLRDLQHAIQQHLPQAAALSVHEVLQWCKAPESLQGVDEAVLSAAREAVQGLKDARAREGSRLKDILLARIADLRQLAGQAEPLVPQVVEKQQQRFLEKWQAALASAGAGQTLTQDAMQERALSEAAAFAIRADREVLVAQAPLQNWRTGWATYESLRFARLCHYLRLRWPDAMIGFSILACGLAPQLATHPTAGYAVLAIGMVGAASCLALYGALLRVMLRTTPPEDGPSSR
mgnify:CR=1 FL=1